MELLLWTKMRKYNRSCLMFLFSLYTQSLQMKCKHTCKHCMNPCHLPYAVNLHFSYPDLRCSILTPHSFKLDTHLEFLNNCFCPKTNMTAFNSKIRMCVWIQFLKFACTLFSINLFWINSIVVICIWNSIFGKLSTKRQGTEKIPRVLKFNL